MPKERHLDVQKWRAPTRSELADLYNPDEFLKRKSKRGSILVVRSAIKQIDIYCYLRARFGPPNGMQTFIKSDASDNIIHWDFHVLSDGELLYFVGTSRDFRIHMPAKMRTADWQKLINNLKQDFGRCGFEKSKILKSLEKYSVFQNKFVILSSICADMHANLVDAPKFDLTLPPIKNKLSTKRYQKALKKITDRSTQIYGDCLKLKLMTPIVAEAYFNMVILVFCNDDIRTDSVAYEDLIRKKIPQRIEQMTEVCTCFVQKLDTSSVIYKRFMQIINKRNHNIHANIDPIKESLETVYFEGKTPLFSDTGDHIASFFRHLETLNAPSTVIKDYEDMHLFLLEMRSAMHPSAQYFFDQVVGDSYPGYEVNTKRTTKILPSTMAVMLLPGLIFDDEIGVN